MINQTILITGGTSGIGLALVNQLSKNNCILVIARSPEKMAALFGTTSNIHCYCCNLASQTAVKNLLEQLIIDHPNISIAINNAAIQYTPFFTANDFTQESINEELQVNLHTPLTISAIFIKHWHQQKKPSAIVNISSALAIYPKTSAAVYCATKAALHSFSLSMNYQLENTCIRIHEAILPLVDTAMTKGRGGKKISAETAAAEIIMGLGKNKKFIFVGKTKWIPLLARINPSLIANMLKKY